MEEVWKDIRGYESLYQVSNLGRIKSLEKRKILKPQLSSRGYYQIGLYKNKAKKGFKVHRLVAEMFLNKENENLVINHKDNNPLNNTSENLEWCTQQYNVKHAFKIGVCNKTIDNCRKLGKSKRKKTIQFDLNNNLIKEWDSATEASTITGICRTSIIRCCNKKYGCNTAGGYIWKYKDNLIEECKLQNIETMTESELARIRSLEESRS